MDGINVARTCDKLSAKLEAAYQRNGFLVRLRGGSGIVCRKLEREDQHDNQIKSIQLSPPIRRQKRSSSTQDSFHSFIDTKIGYHFSDYKKRINLLIPRFLLSFSLCYTILAATKANKKCRKRTYDSLMKVSWLAIELCHHMFVRDKTPLVYTKQ